MKKTKILTLEALIEAIIIVESAPPKGSKVYLQHVINELINKEVDTLPLTIIKVISKKLPIKQIVIPRKRKAAHRAGG